MSPRAEELRQKLIRNTADVTLEPYRREPLYDTQCGRLSDGTAARKLGAGFDILAPGKQSCPYHFHHAQEELFVILEGEGTLRVAGEYVPIRAGDVIFIPPGKDYPHHILNTSSAPIKYLSISTQDTPEVCEYPDSGKYNAYVRGAVGDAEGVRFRAIQRTDNTLDYWDGEP